MRVFWRLRRYILLVIGYGEQCACGATQGCRDTGSPAATTCFFCFCHAGGFGAFGATYYLWLLMGNNAPAALHAVVGIQGRLRRLHAFFVFTIRVGLAPAALHVVG